MLASCAWSLDTRKKAKLSINDSKSVTWYRSLWWPDSWGSQFRRGSRQGGLLGPEGFQLRYVITSLPARRVLPVSSTSALLSPGRDREPLGAATQNCSALTPTPYLQGNQLRLWFSSIACMLIVLCGRTVWLRPS